MRRVAGTEQGAEHRRQRVHFVGTHSVCAEREEGGKKESTKNKSAGEKAEEMALWGVQSGRATCQVKRRFFRSACSFVFVQLSQLLMPLQRQSATANETAEISQAGLGPRGFMRWRRTTWLATKNLISVPEPVFFFLVAKYRTAQEGIQLVIGKTSTLSLGLARRKKKAQKIKAQEKKQRKGHCGECEAAERPVKSNDGCFGQLALLFFVQLSNF